MTMKEYADTRRTGGRMKVPRSVQQSIPIDHIYFNNIWKSGDVYNLMWQISDINYNMMPDNRKLQLQNLYGAVYTVIPSDCWAKFTVVSQKMDARAFRDDILMPKTTPELEPFRKDYNDLALARAKDVGNVIQHKYFILSTNKRSYKEAQERLFHVQGMLLAAISALGSTMAQVNNNDRLQILHNFFRVGSEPYFRFDFDHCRRLGHDFRDYVAPDSMKFNNSYIEIEDKFAKAMSIVDYPNRIDDSAIPDLLHQAPYMVLSMDVIPVEIGDAHKMVDDSRMAVDAEKVRFNNRSVNNGDFTSTLPQRVREQESIVDYLQDGLSHRDQQMFLTTLTLVHFADTLEELNAQTESLKAAANNLNCRLTDMKYQQERTFNTAMPYGLRQIQNDRTMLTESVAALIPFDVQEVMVPKGICYGVNSLSGNLIVGSRLSLVNGNAVVLATSGGGKSMFTKQEIIAILIRYPKAKIFVVDPENEYGNMVRALGGLVVNLAADTNTFFNPLDVPKGCKDPAREKIDFVLTLFLQLAEGKQEMADKGILNSSLMSIYKRCRRNHSTPTIRDLWLDLQAQPLDRAKEIAHAFKPFADGSLDAFAQPTNVDMSNRLICFNVQELGKWLKPVAMLSMLEFININVTDNAHNDPTAATWVYFDEMYLVLAEEQSSVFLWESSKRFRKYNAYLTGITQEVSDCLQSTAGKAMLANSEFVVMLRQSSKDIEKVKELYGLSEAQANLLMKAHPGEGIIKMGNSLIPFNNEYPHNSTYQLITTKPGERLKAQAEE